MFLMETERIASEQREVEEKFKIADEQLKESTDAREKIRQEYDRLGESITEMDEKINAIRENISNTSVMKEKLESQIQILAEQIHTAEMTDEHLQSRLDAIAREQKEKEEAKLPTRKKNIPVMNSLHRYGNDRKKQHRHWQRYRNRLHPVMRAWNRGRKNCLRC